MIAAADQRQCSAGDDLANGLGALVPGQVRTGVDHVDVAAIDDAILLHLPLQVPLALVDVPEAGSCAGVTGGEAQRHLANAAGTESRTRVPTGSLVTWEAQEGEVGVEIGQVGDDG